MPSDQHVLRLEEGVRDATDQVPSQISVDPALYLQCASPRDDRCDHGDGHQCTGRVKLAARSTAESGRS